MSQQRRSRVWVVLALAAIFLLAVPLQAFASLGTSTTNPSEPFWRQEWGNTLYPQFDLNATIPDALGMYYVVDRTETTEIDETRPQDYDASWLTNGSMLNQTLDVQGIFESNPVGFAALEPGARLPVEGLWWYHFSFFDQNQVEPTTYTGPFRIDLTPPLPITKLTAKPYVSYTGATSGVWFPGTRAYFYWEDKEYDALSGTAGYLVSVNDVPLTNDPETVLDVYHLGHTLTSFTIENLPAGKSKISIKSVDRATNQSPAVTTYFYSDPDTPYLKIDAPVADGLVSRNAIFSVTATDAAGIADVRFFVDGVLIGTDTSKPYSLAKDMAAFTDGTHTLVVKARDMYGREVSQSLNFKLDKVAPALSSISDGPDPFYPIIADGYKDTTWVGFYTKEKVYAYLYLYKGDGSLFAARSAYRGPGWTGLTWDGKNAAGSTGIGTFTYRVMVQDPAGNQTWGKAQTITIRDYELVRVAPNAVKVVPR